MPDARIFFRLRFLLLAGFALTLGACANRGAVREASAWSNATQMIAVTTADWNAATGELHRYERESAQAPWREVGSASSVTVGRAGSAWGIGLHPVQSDGPQKREGDGRAPAGVFSLGTAFGY